jgi:hypothetical protein
MFLHIIQEVIGRIGLGYQIYASIHNINAKTSIAIFYLVIHLFERAIMPFKREKPEPDGWQ